MAQKTMLIVEDSKDQMSRCLELAQSIGYDARGVFTLDDAIKHLETRAVDVLLSDVHLQPTVQNSFEGLTLLSHVKDEHPEILVVMMSSDPDIETYNKATALGANHFLRKPIFNGDELLIGIELARSRRNLKTAAAKVSKISLPKSLSAHYQDGIVLPENIRKIAERLAKHRKASSIIMGETGSGKEEVAKLIHRKRCEIEGPVPYVAVNCATLNGDLGTSLLFGHRKGAFTGADQTTNGYIGEANGGILFLDEVHSLSIECQQRLLRVLSGGTYERVGESKPMRSEFQLLSASSVDLSDAVESGKLVEDLYMRLSGANISVPPLRERLEDIPVLVALYFAKEKIIIDEAEILKIAEKCKTFYWRGNVRQLFRSLDNLVVMYGGENGEITADNFVENNDLVKSQDMKMKALMAQLSDISSKDLEKITKALMADMPLSESMDHYEKLVFQAAVNRHPKIIDVMGALDISRSGFDLKRKKYSV